MSLSAFDLDHTLLRKNSSFEFCKYLYRQGVLSFFSLICSFIYYIRHTYLGLSLDQLHHKVFKKLLFGLPMRMLLDHAAVFVERNWQDLVYFPSWEKLRSAQHRGHITIILSNSPSFLVRILAEKFQVDDWKGSEYLVDSEQKLSQIGHILQGRDKALLLQQISSAKGICLKKTTAYSDSILDLCFLHAAGSAVVVNPDQKLKKVSHAFCWEEI